jgi:hypothetical protein
VIVECVELGFVEFIVLDDLRVQTFQGLEELTLVRVVQRLAKVQVLQLFSVTRTRCQPNS